MANENIIDEFISFCSAQDPEKTIDHSYTFEQCALGDFAEHKTKDRQVSHEYSDLIKKLNLKVFKLINDRKIIINKDYETYGEFTKALILAYS